MINISICDDKQDYAKILEYKVKQYLEQLNIEYTITIFSELSDYKKYIETEKQDICFFDIMINDINSIEWIKTNSLPGSMQIIIMTEFPEETYDLSEINCCYYFIKARMSADKLKKALNKAISNLTKKPNEQLIIKTSQKNYSVNPQKIIYIEAYDNYIIIKAEHEKTYTVHSTLKSFMKLLPPYFFRCHKSYAVNMNHITAYDTQFFYVSTGEKIPFPQKKYRLTIDTYKKYISII